MLLEADVRKRGLHGRVSVSLYTPEPGPMPGGAASLRHGAATGREPRRARSHRARGHQVDTPGQRFILRVECGPIRSPGLCPAALRANGGARGGPDR